MELADILDEKSTPTPEPVAAPEPAAPATPEPTPATETRERGADGKFVAKAAEAPTSTPPPVQTPTEQPRQQLTPQERAFLRAAQEERSKRQALEQEIAKLRAVPAEPPKQFWDDPDAALRQQSEQVGEVKQYVENLLIQERMKQSEAAAREKYKDFDDKVAEFAQALQEVPGLAQQFTGAHNPAEFVYKTAKSRIELRESGGIEQLLAKKEAEMRAKIELEFAEKQKKADELRSRVPPSLSQVAGGTGNQSAPAWGGPTPLGAILAR